MYASEPLVVEPIYRRGNSPGCCGTSTIHRSLRSALSSPHTFPSPHDATCPLLVWGAILLLAQEQQEVARLLLMLGGQRVVERQEGVALAVGLREFVVILPGRLADQVERRRAKYGRQSLQLGDARAGLGALDAADVRSTNANLGAQFGLGEAI